MKQFMDKDFLLSTPTAQHLFHDYAAKMPILDYHCHINPKEIAEDRKFENITQVWLGGDHYKWRQMRTNGVDEKYITGDASDREKFQKWAETLEMAIGNPLYHWSHLELQRYFGYNGILNGDTAEEVWNLCNAKLQEDSMSVRNLIKQSNVTLVCTTDDPVDSLEWHQVLKDDKTFDVQVLPAWRPDKAMNIEKPEYLDYLETLSNVSGIKVNSFASLIDALRNRMDFFASMGCKAFTFVTVREQYKIREIIRYTKARIQPGQLPTLRDVSNIRTSKLLDEVRQTLAESSLDRWRVLVEDFQTEHFPDGDASSRDISAALLKLLMQRDFGNQDNVGEVDELTMAPQRPAKNAEAKSKGRMQPLPRRQESGPMSRLHIDVGQAHDVTPRALVGAITGESGIPGRSVGAIDIQNNFSIVEISAELAAHVLATLNKGVFISGVKVSAKAADETDSPHPRKPFAPGQRRQRPGKFGKKPRGATLGRKAYSESR